MLLCFALGLWNGQDPILKERLFGLTNSEGNHGEDVKEYYFYLDSTPTHSYMRCSTSTRRRRIPTTTWSPRTARRSRKDFEYELLDTGVFDEDRYWDVYVEFAKADPEDIADPHHRHQPRPRGGHAAPAAARSGSATPGRGARTRRGPSSRPADHAPVRRRSPAATPSSASASSTARAPASCCSPTTRPTATASGASPTRRRTRRTASTTTSSTAAANAVNPARKGTKVGGSLSRVTVAPGQSASGCGCA